MLLNIETSLIATIGTVMVGNRLLLMGYSKSSPVKASAFSHSTCSIDYYRLERYSRLKNARIINLLDHP